DRSATVAVILPRTQRKEQRSQRSNTHTGNSRQTLFDLLSRTVAGVACWSWRCAAPPLPLCSLCSVSSVLFLCDLGCLYSFEEARVAVFPHSVPVKAAAVHCDVDARRQRLHERQRAAEIEEAVRAAERVGDHRAG